MAAGCSGADWEAVEERWDLRQYHAMQKHWLEVAPPAYITSAANVGYKAKDAPEAGGEEVIENPEDLARALSQMPGGRVRTIPREE